ncbi:hypothetical protein IDJ76_18625 [Mucilaginibacter sp. ZB1P21]|uniref:Competence protein CoiA nuclease-like domain-containing protein n=1 Tax=Mucilaginibacter glaciei TaxID=2772109 RepID=A0A926S7W4_9SPHI|nr:competence protein CoiA family protein [Mucilaginibacter glaciei]MBD1395126.1 hypothetical protein [Mucilaginibacter glaciei]
MEESNTLKVRKTEAYDSRCLGLVGGVAFVQGFKKTASADYVRKIDGPFYCRKCLSEAVVRKCSDKEDHFAHKARLSPAGRRGNTDFHHQVRDELCAILKAQYPDGAWRTEVPMSSAGDDNDLRADIAGYFGPRIKGVAPVAVEVQCSPYSPAYLRKKTAAYAERGVNVLWIVPLTAELGDEPFRPRRYELFLHTMYLGYVFYYEPGSQGLLTPVHYSPAYRYIDPKTFFDTEANEISTGDYWFKYKTLKNPRYTDQLPITDLVAKTLNAWVNPNNNKLNIPQRKIMGVTQAKWWPDDEYQEWLKNNDWFRYVKIYLPDYEPDDENDEFEDNVSG